MDHHQLVKRFIAGITAGDATAIVDLLHDDYTETYPQSGEVLRGKAAWKGAFLENPDLPHGHSIHTTGADKTETQVIRPVGGVGMPLIQLSESGNRFTNESIMEYSNGETRFAVILGEIADGKISSTIMYFCLPFEAPEWRKPFVEQIPTDEYFV